MTGCLNFDSLVRSTENTIGKNQPDVDTAMIDEAGKAYQSGNFTLAEQRYKEYIGKNQRFSDKTSLAVANSQLGRIAFEKSDFKASNRYFEEAIKLDPDNLESSGLYGESLYTQKEYHRAESLFRQALQVAPNDRRFQIMLGLTLAQQKQYQAGLRYLKQALGEQGAYEEMAHIYNSHFEFDKATLAMSKARESYNKQQQLAALSSGGLSIPIHAGQQGTALHHATQFPAAAQTSPYQPTQSVLLSQQQAANMHGLQQQNAVPRQMPMQQYYVMQQPVQTFAAQQPAPPFPQQQPANIPYSYSYQPTQNYGANDGTYDSTMNPAAQPGQYPGIAMPQQQVYENPPQRPRDNRPPQGFAAAQQQPMTTAPVPVPQTIPAPFRYNDMEIAYHPNDSDSQPGVMPPGTTYPMMSSPGMPSPVNPLAERAAQNGQLPVSFPVNSAMPMTGNWTSQAQSPAFYGYQ